MCLYFTTEPNLFSEERICEDNLSISHLFHSSIKRKFDEDFKVPFNLIMIVNFCIFRRICLFLIGRNST